MHARLKPSGHRFSYRVMSLLIDLDRLDAADRQSPLFGVNRAALTAVNRGVGQVAAKGGDMVGDGLDVRAIRQHFLFPQTGRVVTNNAASYPTTP